jgi:transposase
MSRFFFATLRQIYLVHIAFLICDQKTSANSCECMRTWRHEKIHNIHSLIKSIRISLCSSKLKRRCHYNRTYQYKRRQKAVCFSLLSSTSSMGMSGELSDWERGLVIGCHISRKSVREIATLLKLPKSMVGDVNVKWKDEGNTTMKPWMGRPRLMTDRDSRALKVMVCETRQISSETITCEFRSATNCPASTMTVHRELRGMGSMGEQLPINQIFHLWMLSAA